MSELDSFPVVITLPVAWGEMDAFGHVNNAVYFRYFESVRIAYFQRTLIIQQGIPVGVGPILASTSCRFKAALSFPDTVQVGARVNGFTGDRFTMEYAVFSVARQRVAATGDGVVVAFDYKAGRKMEIPDAWRSAIDSIETTAKPAPA